MSKGLQRPLRMVSLRGFSAGYGENKAFNNLFLDLIEGQCSVFLGPGKSGKSSLLKVLSGTFSETENAWTQGNYYFPWSDAAFVAQKMTPSETLSLADLIKQTNPRVKRPERQIELCWKGFPKQAQLLLNHLEKPLGDLEESLQRLARVTLAIIEKQEMVLLDEPEVGLGMDGLDALIDTLNRLKKKRTLIIVTHHLRLAREVGDFIVLMAYGRIIEAKPRDLFFNHPSHPYTQSVIRMGC